MTIWVFFISPENTLALSALVDLGANESFIDWKLTNQFQPQTLLKSHQACALS